MVRKEERGAGMGQEERERIFQFDFSGVALIRGADGTQICDILWF